MTLKYTTQITPAQWTFFVWDFTYFWVLAMYIYFLLALCRRYVPFVVFTHTIHMRLQCLATASHSRNDSIFVFFYLIYEKLHVENHPTWSRGNLDCLRAVIFSFDIADCSHAVLWVWLFPHRHSFCILSPYLTILSMLPTGMLMTGCTPCQQCYPMAFMSLL